MKRLTAMLLVCAVAVGTARAQDAPAPASAATPAPQGPPAAESERRSAALDLAGAFTNDGYKLRDGFWFAKVGPRKPQRIVVNLFSGNQYWFCAAGARDAGLKLAVYDSKGLPVEAEGYSDEGRVAAGINASTSGPHYVEITAGEGGESDFCLLYLFK